MTTCLCSFSIEIGHSCLISPYLKGHSGKAKKKTKTLLSEKQGKILMAELPPLLQMKQNPAERKGSKPSKGRNQGSIYKQRSLSKF